MNGLDYNDEMASDAGTMTSHFSSLVTILQSLAMQVHI